MGQELNADKWLEQLMSRYKPVRRERAGSYQATPENHIICTIVKQYLTDTNQKFLILRDSDRDIMFSIDRVSPRVLVPKNPKTFFQRRIEIK